MRIDRSTVPRDIFCYDIRHRDDDGFYAAEYTSNENHMTAALPFLTKTTVSLFYVDNRKNNFHIWDKYTHHNICKHYLYNQGYVSIASNVLVLFFHCFFLFSL
jgi:hypothetical protein